MLCYVMLCYVMLCCSTFCYVMLCYVMLCYVMLCYVMLCYRLEISHQQVSCTNLLCIQDMFTNKMDPYQLGIALTTVSALISAIDREAKSSTSTSKQRVEKYKLLIMHWWLKSWALPAIAEISCICSTDIFPQSWVSQKGNCRTDTNPYCGTCHQHLHLWDPNSHRQTARTRSFDCHPLISSCHQEGLKGISLNLRLICWMIA